jgi:hypothetical protein
MRLAEFWKSHLWGGPLDPLAGTTGALPIATENEALRPAIAAVWTWSNWGIVKDILTLQGAVMGDAIIRVVDSVENEKVYLEAIHPGTIADLQTDRFGNIKAYCIEEVRLHPSTGKTVNYRETAEHGDNEDIIYKTYLNGVPFGWNADAGGDPMPEWVEPYGFIPLVHIQHNNVGQGWGWSEFHPARSKMHECDDLASMLSDQIRKSINPKWLITGATKPDTTAKAATAPTAARPEPGREEQDALYAKDPQAKAQALVAPLDIAGTVLHITEILKELERDYPELKFDALRAAGAISGAALRIARQPAETKVAQRRGNYDNALVRAQQMAVAIAGFRKLPGFAGFGLDSFAKGQLNHSIGSRSVFAVDPLDKLEESKVFWEAAGLATKANAPLDSFLRDSGWTVERIAAFLDSPEYKARLALLTQAATAAGAMGIKEGTGATTGAPVSPEAAPANLDSVQGLNGIQITAAQALLAGVTAGTLAPAAAEQLLVALGIDPAKVKIIIEATVALEVPAVGATGGPNL